MYELKTVRWEDCKEVCETLYNNNIYLTPYQEYCFLNRIGIGRKETNPFCTIGFRDETYILYKDTIPKAVVPLYINRIKRIILLRGHYSIIGHLDFVYADNIDNNDYDYLFTCLAKKYSDYTFVLERISEKSLTCKYFAQKKLINDEMRTVCVSIPIEGGYEEWYQSLKKSFKQDIRSGNNRLKTDGKEYRFVLDRFNPPDDHAKTEMLKLYTKRACEHSGIESRYISNVVRTFLFLTKRRNPFNVALENSEHYIGGRIYIDNTMVAYCQCLLSNDGRVIVPKLSIDLEYKRYNLGGLLISEMIKALCEIGAHTRCKEFDLSRGDERYKYDYGGKNHYNYDVNLSLRELR